MHLIKENTTGSPRLAQFSLVKLEFLNLQIRINGLSIIVPGKDLL